MKSVLPLALTLAAALAASPVHARSNVEEEAQEAAYRLMQEGRRIETLYKGPRFRADPLSKPRVMVDYELPPTTSAGFTVRQRLNCGEDACSEGTGTGRFDELETIITDASGAFDVRVQDHGANGFKQNEGALLTDSLVVTDHRGKTDLEFVVYFIKGDAFVDVYAQDQIFRDKRYVLLHGNALVDKKYSRLLSWLNDAPGSDCPLDLKNGLDDLREWVDETREYFGLPSAPDSLTQ